MEALDTLSDRREKKDNSEFYLAFEQKRQDMVILKVVESLEGKSAARAFIDARLETDAFRKLAIEEDMAEGHFDRAERLCLEKIARLELRGYGRPPEWWYILYDIYEKTNNRQKLISTAKSLLFQGDQSYYNKLKALYQQSGEWEQTYPVLRSELKLSLPTHSYMRILGQENEHVLLFEQVKEHSEAIFDYGKMLAGYYPKAVFEIYTIEIKKAAREANDRGQYKKVCGLIRELYKAGGKEEALTLSDLFIDQYKRRPAMVDELSIMKKGLK